MGVIRGSQLVGHSVRMGGQSLHSILVCTLGLWFIAAALIFYSKFDLVHQHHLKTYLQVIDSNFFGKNNEFALIKRDIYRELEKKAEKNNTTVLLEAIKIAKKHKNHPVAAQMVYSEIVPSKLILSY